MGKRGLERRLEDLEEEAEERKEPSDLEVVVREPGEDPPEDFDPVNNPRHIQVGGDLDG